MRTLNDLQNYIYELKTEIRKQDDYFLKNDFLIKTLFNPEHFIMLEKELKYCEKIKRKLENKIFGY